MEIVPQFRSHGAFFSLPHSSKKPILKNSRFAEEVKGGRKKGAIIPDIRAVSRVGRPIMSHFQPFISLIQCTPAPLSHSSTFFRYWLAISSFGNCAELIDRDDILLLLEEVKSSFKLVESNSTSNFLIGHSLKSLFCS